MIPERAQSILDFWFKETPSENNVIQLDTSKKEPQIFEEEKQETKKPKPLVLTEEVVPSPAPVRENRNDTLSPAVRKIVTENNIDIGSVQGSGKNGQVLKGDLISLMGANPKPSERKIQYGQEERIKMTRLRQTIAKRLKQAQENAALLTTFNEVDMTNIMEMRKENQQDFQSRYGIKLGFMSFFVKACVVALKHFPAVNAEIDGDEIIYKNYYNISFAVGTDKGLVVPVLRNADELSFADIEKNIKDISEKYIIDKETAPFALMYVASEGVYQAIMNSDKEFTKLAREKNVVIVSPNTIFGFLKTYRLFIDNKEMSEKADIIQKEFAKIYDEITVFADRFSAIDKRNNQLSEDFRKLQISIDKISRRSERVKDLEFDSSLSETKKIGNK